MRYGWLVDPSSPWPDVLARATQVQALGYDSIWLSDHVVDLDGRRLADPWVSAAAIAVAVPNIEVGTLVAANSLRHPAVTAQLANTLTDISGGRFVLGVGAGGAGDEHRAVGIEFPELAERAERLAEACRLFRGASGGGASRYGPLHPTAAAAVRVSAPLLVGGTSEAVLAVVARYADRWLYWAEPELAGRQRGRLERHAAAAGRPVSQIEHGIVTMLAPDHLAVRAGPAPAWLTGDAAAMTEQLDRYANAAVAHIVVCDHAVSADQRAESLRWFARHVARRA